MNETSFLLLKLETNFSLLLQASNPETIQNNESFSLAIFKILLEASPWFQQAENL